MSVIETPNPIMLEYIFPTIDLKSISSFFDTSKRNLVNILASLNVCNNVNWSYLPPNSNVIGASFDLTLNNYVTGREKSISRFVGKVFNDEMKDFILKNSPNLRQNSAKIILSVSEILNYRTSMIDFIQAYLQVKEKLTGCTLLSVMKTVHF